MSFYFLEQLQTFEGIISTQFLYFCANSGEILHKDVADLEEHKSEVFESKFEVDQRWSHHLL